MMPPSDEPRTGMGRRTLIGVFQEENNGEENDLFH
jgi:hypothetical protein